jgi:hypothetical protein
VSPDKVSRFGFIESAKPVGHAASLPFQPHLDLHEQDGEMMGTVRPSLHPDKCCFFSPSGSQFETPSSALSVLFYTVLPGDFLVG